MTVLMCNNSECHCVQAEGEIGDQCQNCMAGQLVLMTPITPLLNAAPDLLKACELMIDADDKDERIYARIFCKSSIKKAKGE